MLDDVSNVARYLAQTTDQMDYLIEDTKALKDSLDVYYPDLQSALDDSKELVNRTTDALNNSTNSLTLVQNTVRASSDSLDAAAKDSIKGKSECPEQEPECSRQHQLHEKSRTHHEGYDGQ